MVFQNPHILYGLFLLSIPILIHFLNFRRTRTVYFSSLKFLTEIESSNRNRKRIQDLLLLLLRVLLLGTIIIAFAQPVIPVSDSRPNGNSTVGLFIDNSASMGIRSGSRTLLDNTKDLAGKLIQSSPPNSRYFLMSSSGDVRFDGLCDREMALQRLAVLSPRGPTRTMEGILDRAMHTPQGAGGLVSLFIFSDFTSNMFTGNLLPDSTGLRIHLIPARADSVNNLAIDSCWFESPVHRLGESDVLSVRIHNYSNNQVENLPVSLFINDSLRGEVTTSIRPASSIIVTMPYTVKSAGWQKGRIALPDSPYEDDNDLFFSYSIQQRIPILFLYNREPNPYFQRLFESDSNYLAEFYPSSGYPGSDFSSYRLVILEQVRDIGVNLQNQLMSYLRKAGTLWLIPDPTVSLDNWNQFLSGMGSFRLKGAINYPLQTVIGKDLTGWFNTVVVNPGKQPRMPEVLGSLIVDPGTDRFDELVTARTGELLMGLFRPFEGNLVINSFSFRKEVTDFMVHPLFIPLTLRIATLSSYNQTLFELIGANNPIDIKGIGISPTNQVEIVDPVNSFVTVPVVQIGGGGVLRVFPDGVTQSGHYFLKSGETLLSLLSFNQDRSESDLEIVTADETKKILTDAGYAVQIGNSESIMNNNSNTTTSDSKPLWPIFLIISMILLFIESFMMNKKISSFA